MISLISHEISVSKMSLQDLESGCIILWIICLSLWYLLRYLFVCCLYRVWMYYSVNDLYDISVISTQISVCMLSLQGLDVSFCKWFVWYLIGIYSDICLYAVFTGPGWGGNLWTVHILPIQWLQGIQKRTAGKNIGRFKSSLSHDFYRVTVISFTI